MWRTRHGGTKVKKNVRSHFDQDNGDDDAEGGLDAWIEFGDRHPDFVTVHLLFWVFFLSNKSYDSQNEQGFRTAYLYICYMDEKQRFLTQKKKKSI